MSEQPGEFPQDDAFMLYATFCGDVERTAHALSVPESEVIRKAKDGDWDHKLRGIIELKKSSKPGDIERAINRAINFVQAHKFRMFLERLVQRLCSMPQESLDEYMVETRLSSTGKPIQKISTRPMADLASAIEKAHAMTYMALGDSSGERKVREEASEKAGPSGGELHAKIAAAMAQGKMLSDAQDQQARPK